MHALRQSLYLLLCLAIAFNGASVAFAADHLSIMQNTIMLDGKASAEHEMAASQKNSCQHQVQKSSPVDHYKSDRSDHTQHASTEFSTEPSPCCTDSDCQSLCQYAASSAFITTMMIDAISVNDLLDRKVLVGHLPPTLPHLMRPPIV